MKNENAATVLKALKIRKVATQSLRNGPDFSVVAKPLKKSGVISNAVFDQREMTARTASAQLVATRDGLKVAEAERAQVVAQRRELDWRRSNTEVKAPAEGIVSRRTARVGALASAAGEALFRIVADGAVELEAEVPESEIARLAEGQRAVITVTGIGDLQGRVRLVPAEIAKAILTQLSNGKGNLPAWAGLAFSRAGSTTAGLNFGLANELRGVDQAEFAQDLAQPLVEPLAAFARTANPPSGLSSAKAPVTFPQRRLLCVVRLLRRC